MKGATGLSVQRQAPRHGREADSDKGVLALDEPVQGAGHSQRLLPRRDLLNSFADNVLSGYLI